METQDSMPTRNFGHAGCAVQFIGLGGAFLEAESRDAGIAAVHAAIERGVNYIDTSPGYIQNRSQPLIGDALKGGWRDRVVLATKLGYLTHADDHRNVELIRKQVEDNLKLLGVDSVDVLQVHEADMAHWWADGAGRWERIDPTGDYDFGDAPVMQVLRDAKRRGLCQYIGITGNEARPMTRVLSEVEVDSLLLAYNFHLLRREALEAAYPLAASRGMAIVNGGVFDSGRLAQVQPDWLEQAPDWMTPRIQKQYADLYQIAADSNMSLIELTLRFLLAERRLSVVLIGARFSSDIEQAVDAAARGPLDPILHERVQSLVPAV